MSSDTHQIPLPSPYSAALLNEKHLTTPGSSTISSPTDVVANDLAENENAPCGSLESGKHRQQDAPQNIDLEKRVTQRATSKEFHFPKSN